MLDPKSILHQAYDPKQFREQGHALVDLLADHFTKAKARDGKVLKTKLPDEAFDYWQQALTNQCDPIDLFKDILDQSIHLHHPRYLGHQVGVPAFLAPLAGLLSDALNNGMGVYEMGMAANAIERVVIEWTAKQMGLENGSGGLLTSGGTLANLTALLTARSVVAPSDVWEEGSQEKLAVMVSEEAHYCIDRAARILGLGAEGVIKIPANDDFQICTDLLGTYLAKAEAAGRKVIAIVGCACTTSTGSYDDLLALGAFAQKHHLWFHVDGAHGGAAAFSNKYQHLVKGIELADSVALDFHKMLMVPALNTALFYKNSQHAYQTFHQKAHYLWSAESEEWYHSAKKTFECTKLMMSIKVYALIQTYGLPLFQENVDCLYGLARAFAQKIKENTAFELLQMPEANIVNFRYLKAGEELNACNEKIRERIVEKGDYYIVQTKIKGAVYLRMTIMNPFSEMTDLEDLLEEIDC